MEYLIKLKKFYYLILYIFLIFIKENYSIDIIIRNTEESIKIFKNSLQSLSFYDESVNFYFPDPIYSFHKYKEYSIAINFNGPISFISTSENKTIFDYGNYHRYSLAFEIIIKMIISGKFILKE